jgi:hypothetical protein
MPSAPVSVIEFAGYLRRAEDILNADERDDVINALAYAPLSGDLIPGTGGLRKVRIARAGTGKRGGARVIYYFYNEEFPLLLLAIYAKNAQSDLSASEKRLLSELMEGVTTKWQKQ